MTITHVVTVHLPDEVVELAKQAERDGEQLVAFCRDAERAKAVSQLLLRQMIGSALLPPDATEAAAQSLLANFGYGDFTVLFVTDAHNTGWTAPSSCRQVLHVDLPAASTARILVETIRDREARIPVAARALAS